MVEAYPIMEIYPALLFRLLLASFIFGAIMGVLYDTIRIQRVLLGMNRYTAAASAPVFCPKFYTGRKRKPHGKASHIIKCICLAVQDVLFCLAVGVLLAILLFYQNNGEFRGFVLVGVVAGFCAYYFTVGKLVIHASEYLVFALKTAVLYAVYYLSLPFIVTGRFLVTRISRWLGRQKEKRNEKAVARYHAKRCGEFSAAAQNGFLGANWTETEKTI